MTDIARTLAGRTALVTGGARRLGRAIALALAERGAGVVIHYRSSADEAEATAKAARAAGAEAWTLQADLGDAAEATTVLARGVELAGPIDILVNNASMFPESTLGDFTVEDLAANVQLHAMAPLELARALAGQGIAGNIINMVDSRITDYDRLHVAYHLSKRMLADLTKLMAIEMAPGVRVNAVAPGLILPPEGEDASYLQRLASTNPLDAYGSPEDVTRAVAFLLESPFVTGQVIFVDGGRHMRGRLYD